jgi:hypoxanthine phosphoribosyltransferase
VEHPPRGATATAEPYLSRDVIAARVAELGTEIACDYVGSDLLLVGVLRGAFVFLADLARATSIPLSIDFVALAGYAGGQSGSGAVRIMKDLDAPIAGRDVLIVENVVDTGLTLNYLVRTLALREPAGLAVCTLLDRPYRRLVDDLPLRYVGFTVPDEFYVGYGFDLDGRSRGLPDLRAVGR